MCLYIPMIISCNIWFHAFGLEELMCFTSVGVSREDVFLLSPPFPMCFLDTAPPKVPVKAGVHEVIHWVSMWSSKASCAGRHLEIKKRRWRNQNIGMEDMSGWRCFGRSSSMICIFGTRCQWFSSSKIPVRGYQSHVSKSLAWASFWLFLDTGKLAIPQPRMPRCVSIKKCQAKSPCFPSGLPWQWNIHYSVRWFYHEKTSMNRLGNFPLPTADLATKHLQFDWLIMVPISQYTKSPESRLLTSYSKVTFCSSPDVLSSSCAIHMWVAWNPSLEPITWMLYLRSFL